MQTMPPAFDSIIVLANLMDNKSYLNEESRGRADMAAQAFRAGKAPFIVTTGWDYKGQYPMPMAAKPCGIT